MNEYEDLKKAGAIGFAHVYLRQCKESKTENELDIQILTKLVDLDSKIGTTASEQLTCYLKYTSRSDIIQVFILT